MKLWFLLEMGIRYVQGGRVGNLSGDIDAINRLARGNVSQAAHMLRLDVEKYKPLDRTVPDFDVDLAGWLEAMSELVIDLKEIEDVEVPTA